MSANSLVAGQPFNPFRIFVGSFIPNALMRFPGLSSTSKLVWARLAQYAGESGVAHPKQETIAYELGVTDRAIRFCLVELVREGFLRVIKPDRNNRTARVHDQYEFLYHPCFSASSGDHRKKLPVPPEKTSGDIYRCEDNPVKDSTPLNPPKGGNPSSNAPNDQKNDPDLVSAGEWGALLGSLTKRMAGTALKSMGLNGRSAPPP